jgi:predicted amidohydrolase YtcJ
MPAPRHLRSACITLLFATLVHAAERTPANDPADQVLQHGIIATIDAGDHVVQAIAIRGGRIVYVGSDVGAKVFIGTDTRVTDLHGRMVMPGLIDGHMHPLDGGGALMTCNLDYAPLTLPQFSARIQACLDASKDQEPAGWLQVTGWYRQFMRPPGTDASAATLDALKTERPIVVASTDGHTIVTNHRGLALAGINSASPDVADGRIGRDALGNPTGVLEDGGQRPLTAVLPKPDSATERKMARAALAAMREQGITTFLDAAASPGSIAAFSALYKEGGLTARAHFAPVIDVKDAADPVAVVAALKITKALYDSGPTAMAPAITVRNAKIFMDGVLQAPAQTAVLMAPYRENFGTAAAPHWVSGTKTGEVYFPAEVLNPLLVALGEAGIEPHIHAIGDRAVHQALDAIEVMRNAVPDPELRVAIAHDELVDPADYGRFEALNATPVMSFQWAKPGPDSIDATRDYLGPERFARMEPEGLLYEAHARIAYGSDWPVDRLNEWFALKVGITRTGDPALGARYAGRLNAQKGLPREAALRAVTMNAAYELHQDADTGSLEVGKLADLIVLDRNVLKIPADQIAGTRVLLTLVGGNPVYRAKDF